MAKAQTIPGLRADVPYAQAAAVSVRLRATELFAHAEGVLDTGEVERVHDMRVASRRLRAVLELYGPCFPADERKTVERDLRRIARALGDRRDLDVQIDGLERFAAVLPVVDHPGLLRFMRTIRAEQATANERLARALGRIESRGLAERVAALADAAEQAIDPEHRLADQVAGIVRRRLKQVLELAPDAQEADQVDAQHALRIAAKRLRYALEATAPVCFGPYAAKAIGRVRDLQDVIGEMHDCDAALPRVEREIEALVVADAAALRERAGDALDLDPALVGELPHAGEHRGLATLRSYLVARRTLLHEQFLALWHDLQREGFASRLEFALTEGPETITRSSPDGNVAVTPPT